LPGEEQGSSLEEFVSDEEAQQEKEQMMLDYPDEDESVEDDVHLVPPVEDEAASVLPEGEEDEPEPELAPPVGDDVYIVPTTEEMEEENKMSEEAIYVATAEAEVMKTDMTTRKASDETALITVAMKITGDIVSEGSLELQGGVRGNIDVMGKLNITGTIDGDSKAAEIYADNAKINGEIRSDGSVKIGQSTIVIGNILASSAVVAGAVKGDIDVQGPVILDTSAIVMGNIKSKSLQINNGAVIEGMCSQCYAEVNPTSFFGEMKKEKEKEKEKSK
jgi:cytoskeletal protein CcmA (bactofilin family)